MQESDRIIRVRTFALDLDVVGADGGGVRCELALGNVCGVRSEVAATVSSNAER
jgi:hypothetical protein